MQSYSLGATVTRHEVTLYNFGKALVIEALRLCHDHLLAALEHESKEHEKWLEYLDDMLGFFSRFVAFKSEI